MIWYQVFLSNTNNLLTDQLKLYMGLLHVIALSGHESNVYKRVLYTFQNYQIQFSVMFRIPRFFLLFCGGGLTGASAIYITIIVL